MKSIFLVALCIVASAQAKQMCSFFMVPDSVTNPDGCMQADKSGAIEGKFQLTLPDSIDISMIDEVRVCEVCSWTHKQEGPVTQLRLFIAKVKSNGIVDWFFRSVQLKRVPEKNEEGENANNNASGAV